jgi:hypothetical protein
MRCGILPSSFEPTDRPQTLFRDSAWTIRHDPQQNPRRAGTERPSPRGETTPQEELAEPTRFDPIYKFGARSGFVLENIAEL